MLPGFTSRWTIPRWWAAWRARAASAAIRAAWRGGSGAGPLDDRGEVLAVDELHDDERPGLVLAVVVDRDDVRVVQRGRGLRLLAEARAEVGVAAVLGAEDLDGDVAVELVVVGAVDPGHPALAEQLDQPVAAAEDRPDLRSRVAPSRAASRSRRRRSTAAATRGPHRTVRLGPARGGR